MHGDRTLQASERLSFEGLGEIGFSPTNLASI